MIVVTKVADDASEGIVSIALGRNAFEEVAQIYAVLKSIYC